METFYLGFLLISLVILNFGFFLNRFFTFDCEFFGEFGSVLGFGVGETGLDRGDWGFEITV